MSGNGDAAEAYISTTRQRFKDERFHIDNNITYKNQHFEYIAKRIRFEIDKLSFVDTFFLLARFSSLDRNALREFSAKCFRYAKRARGIISPRGLFYGIGCCPIAIVDDIDDDLSKSIRSSATYKHFAAFEMPVVYSLASRTLYYCEVTPVWGSLYYYSLRLTINAMLLPE